MERERASGSSRGGRDALERPDRERSGHKDRERDNESRRDHRHSEKHAHDGDRERHRDRDRRRSRSRSRSPDRHRRHRRHRHDSEASSSGAESGSESDRARRRRRKHRDEEEDSEYERRRRRRKERERRDETSQERADRRQRKKEKKHSRESKRSGKGGAIMDYGKHGVINETDITSRLTSEFRQWLVEERHINPETISRGIEKKEMATFIEDYNTATMPSDKYYNLEAHERRMAMIRAGETVEDEGGYDPLADEKAAKASFKAQRRAEETSRGTPAQWQSKEQLEALHKVQMERIEAAKMKQLGIQISANKGVRMDGTEFDRR
jgi:hypothetical protein